MNLFLYSLIKKNCFLVVVFMLLAQKIDKNNPWSGLLLCQNLSSFGAELLEFVTLHKQTLRFYIYLEEEDFKFLERRQN